jgi:hypothetical protein
MAIVYNVPSDDIRPIDVGIGPVSMFRSNAIVFNDTKVPMQVGMVPESAFILKLIRSRTVAEHIELGTVPMITLLPISKSFNFVNDPYDDGIVPEIIVLLKKRILSN